MKIFNGYKKITGVQTKKVHYSEQLNHLCKMPKVCEVQFFSTADMITVFFNKFLFVELDYYFSLSNTF